MNKTVLFLVTLILTSFCSTSRKLSFDGLIDQLVQLNLAAGQDASDVGILVSKVSSGFNEASTRFDAFMTQSQNKCTSGQQLLSNYLTTVGNMRLDMETRANSARLENELLNVQHGEFEDQVDVARIELDALKSRVAAALDELKVYGSETEEKLMVIRSLREVINDELLAPGAGNAFVQLRTFNDKLRELKSLLKNSKDNTYAPLVSTLLTLAEGRGFSDSETLTKILAALDKLEQSLVAFRNRQNTEGKSSIENLKVQIQEKSNQVKSLSTMAANAYSTVQSNENIQHLAAQDIASIDNEVVRKNQEVAYWAKVCGYQADINSQELVFRNAFDAKLKEVSAFLSELNATPAQP